MTLEFSVLGLQLNWPMLVALGFLAGTIGALFGVGGGVVTTAFLNIVGAPMPVAVGTSAVVIAGSACMTTVRNRKLQNIEWKVGLVLAAFMVPSVEISALVMRHVQSTNPAGLDPWLRAVFIITVLVTTAVWWFKREGPPKHSGFWGRIRLRPWLHLNQGHVISLWVLAGSGVLAGFFAGFLGLGGGRVLMPVLLGVVALGVKRAIGTSSLVILVSAVYSSITYSSKGLTDFAAAGLLLSGSLVGAWFGNAAMYGLPPIWLRVLYLCLSMNALLSLGLKQAELPGAALSVQIGGCAGIAGAAYIRARLEKTKDQRSL